MISKLMVVQIHLKNFKWNTCHIKHFESWKGCFVGIYQFDFPYFNWSCFTNSILSFQVVHNYCSWSGIISKIFIWFFTFGFSFSSLVKERLKILQFLDFSFKFFVCPRNAKVKCGGIDNIYFGIFIFPYI